MLSLHQGFCGSRSETAVVSDAEEPLQHDRCRAVRCARAALLDGRKHELVVGRAGVHTGLDAQPCSLASARVGVDDGGLVVPVDADRTKALRGRDNAKSDGVDAPVFRPPVGRNAVQMAARPAAAYAGCTSGL